MPTKPKAAPALPPSPGALHRAMVQLRAVKDELLAIDPAMAEDEKLFTDMLEGESGDALEVVARVVRAAIGAEGMAEAAKRRIEEIAGRKTRYERKAEAMRKVAMDAMVTLSLSKLEREDFTASIAAGRQKVIITDERGLAAEYMRPQPSLPDKVAIAKVLGAGKFVAGAVLSNPEPTFSVRTH